MPRTIEELTMMIAKRDGITYKDALAAVRDTAAEIELAIINGSLDDAEDALRYNLSLEPDYLDIFIM